MHYDQWNRFENFLKFATKKEIKDRLKEFDPPPFSNYIDPETLDKIKNSHKQVGFIRKDTQGQKPLSMKEENKIRIEKMKQLYGLYKQFEEEEKNDSKDKEEEVVV